MDAKLSEKFGDLADITIECSGAESSIRLAILVSARVDSSNVMTLFDFALREREAEALLSSLGWDLPR